MLPQGVWIMISAVGGLLLFFFLVLSLSNRYNLNNIKDKTVGHGQHGTARWATKKEIRRIYKHINYEPDKWREDPDSRPKEQGIVVGCKNRKMTIFTNFMRRLTLSAGTYWLRFGEDNVRDYYHVTSQSDLDVNTDQWLTAFDTNKGSTEDYELEITEAGEYTFYARWGGKEEKNDGTDPYYIYVDVKKGNDTSAGGDDSTDTEGKAKLYVLDGVRTNGDFGTSSFGTTVISSAKSGVVKTNYYDATDAEQVISTDAGHSEGGLIYYYDESEDLNFRVSTTIAANHQAIGVRAFVMNGMTFPAKKNADGTYYADITLVSNYYKDLLGDGYSQDKARKRFWVVTHFYGFFKKFDIDIVEG